LKKVAKVFPSEDEMESLEWLMRRWGANMMWSEWKWEWKKNE
jgi:hypothetical protein